MHKKDPVNTFTYNDDDDDDDDDDDVYYYYYYKRTPTNPYNYIVE